MLAARLGERGYMTRLVTGFLYDAGALRRHRWVLVLVGRDWLPVDPMLDQVPALPAHLALAVHGASLDELAFVDDVAYAGWDHARAEAVALLALAPATLHADDDPLAATVAAFARVGGAGSPSLSPDGKRLACVSNARSATASRLTSRSCAGS